MERKIVVYGLADKRPGLAFPTASDLEEYIKEDIFTENRGRFRFNQGKDADVIVLSRDGLAYGHFEVEDKVSPDEADYQAYDRVKFVYIVGSSALYGKRVHLADLDIKGIQFGLPITEAQFDQIKKAAGCMKEYRPSGEAGVA